MGSRGKSGRGAAGVHVYDCMKREEFFKKKKGKKRGRESKRGRVRGKKQMRSGRGEEKEVGLIMLEELL